VSLVAWSIIPVAIAAFRFALRPRRTRRQSPHVAGAAPALSAPEEVRLS
jgi:hypothetical protein